MNTLYWITGLPGAGKTTLGQLFFSYLKTKNPTTLFLDGDELRSALGVSDQAYSKQEREKLAMQYAKLCKLLVDQGMDVVCATVSLFHSVQQWNRRHITNYCEIFIKVPFDILLKRDQKNLYSKTLKGEIKEVVGMDITIEEPVSPDIVLMNDGKLTPKEILEQLLKKTMCAEN